MIVSPTPSVIDVSNMPRTVAPGARDCKAFGARFPTRVSVALYHACKRFKGGITAVAKLIEIDSDVLQKKLSPTCYTHNLTLDEAERVMLAIRDPAPPIEFARTADLACIPMPREEDGPLQKTMAEMAKEFADILIASSDAMTDGVISENDCANVERQGAEFIVAYSHHLARMRAMAESREVVGP